jgi:hypothetical protein
MNDRIDNARFPTRYESTWDQRSSGWNPEIPEDPVMLENSPVNLCQLESADLTLGGWMLGYGFE